MAFREFTRLGAVRAGSRIPDNRRGGGGHCHHWAKSPPPVTPSPIYLPPAKPLYVPPEAPVEVQTPEPVVDVVVAAEKLKSHFAGDAPEETPENFEEGTVVRWDSVDGFGRAMRPDGSWVPFARFCIESAGEETLRRGSKILFQIDTDRKGKAVATNIWIRVQGEDNGTANQ